MRTGTLDSTHGMIRLNHLHPPFNNVKARQAMYYFINQENFLRAIVGDPKYYRICHGLITCGSPLGNDGGSHWFKEYNPKKALQLLKEAGYNGEPITVLANDRSQHHHAGNPGADPGHARGRHQRRRPVDQLGLGGVAARQEGAAGAGRLEHLRHHHRRRRLGPTRSSTPGWERPATRVCSAGRATPRSRSSGTTTPSP